MKRRKIKGFIKSTVPAALLLSASAYFMLSFTADEKLAILSKPTAPVEEESGSIFIENNPESTLNVGELLSQIVKDPGKSVRLVSDTAMLSNEKYSLPGAGNKVAEGYYTTNATYNADTCIIAKMTPSFELPDTFSKRSRIEQDLEIKQLEMYSEFTPVYTDREAPRPALEMYMGYILYDNGETIDLYTNTGVYVLTFDDGIFVPAYTRDRNGTPLFYRIEQVETGLYIGESIVRDEEETHRIREPRRGEYTLIVNGKVKREGEDAIEDIEDKEAAEIVAELGLQPIKKEDKVYYCLPSNGGYFVEAEYNDAVDNRGLYFDYPSYYGIPDSNISLLAENYDRHEQTLKGEIKSEHHVDWFYSIYGNKLTETVYERAFNFSEGLGCIVSEGYYKDGGLSFVNASGRRAFNTITKYNNVYMDRYIIENYMPPVTNGPESIGYYYYDHGLVRARFETIDYWLYTDNNRKLYYSSKEVLLNDEGEQFPIPVGYEIVSYSDGMICLERDGLYGYMDYTGAWIAEPIYKSAKPFPEGLAVLETADGRFGMIDTGGHIVLPFAYSHLSSCSDGVILGYSEDSGWEIMRKMIK